MIRYRRVKSITYRQVQQLRYDIVILKEYLRDALVEQFLNTLSSHRFRAQRLELGGYDTQHTADIVATPNQGLSLAIAAAWETVTAEAIVLMQVARK